MLGMVLVALFSASCSRKQDAAPQPPPPPLEYLGEWGAHGDGPGQLSDPAGLAADSAGNVYIADPGSGFVHKFDPGGRPLLSFQDLVLSYPGGIAVDRGGAIYVTDPLRGNVVIFYVDGTRLREIRAGTRESKSPLSVTVDDDGRIFVADAAAGRVQKFDVRGHLLKAWGKTGGDAGDLKSPSGIDAGPDGFVYVSDMDNHRIAKFTREGEFLAEFGAPAAPGAGPVLAGLAVSEKYVFVADAAAHGIHVWTLDGQYKLADELGKRLAGNDRTPVGVAVTPRGELLVLDRAGRRVLRFRINF